MKKNLNNFKDIGWASSLGLTLVFSLIIGIGIGVLLDRLFNTYPYLAIIFTLLGIISGFYSVIKETIYRSKKK